MQRRATVDADRIRRSLGEQHRRVISGRVAAGERELCEETDLVAVGARTLGAPYVNALGSTYGMQAVLCECASDEPIGHSSSFEGGLPVSEELGFPENDAWRWVTADEIRQYKHPVESNYQLLAEALRISADRSTSRV